jgi:hypothetical protein
LRAIRWAVLADAPRRAAALGASECFGRALPVRGIRDQQLAVAFCESVAHGSGGSARTRIDARRVMRRCPLLRTRTRATLLPADVRSIRTVTRRRRRLRGATDVRRQQTLPFRRRAPRVARSRVDAAGRRTQTFMGPAAPGPRLITMTVMVTIDPALAVAALMLALTESVSGSS